MDITAQKQAEEALQLSEKKYRTMVEASPDGIISVDPQGYIVDCNTGICKLLGYMTEELKGTDVNRVVTRVESRLEAGNLSGVRLISMVLLRQRWRWYNAMARRFLCGPRWWN